MLEDFREPRKALGSNNQYKQIKNYEKDSDYYRYYNG